MADKRFDEEEFKTRFKGKLLLRLIQLLRPHWKPFAGFLIFISLTSVCDGIYSYLSKLIIDEGILAADKARLLSLLTGYGLLGLLQATMILAFIFLAGFLGERVQYDLRKRMFNHLQDLSFSYFSRTPVGWIMSRVTSDSAKIAELVTWGMVDITWASINILTTIIFMLIINWKLALVVMNVIPLMILIAVGFQKRILAQYRRVRKLNSKITGVFNENITGVRVIKALCREKANLAAFSVQTTNMYRASYRAAWLSSLFLPAIQITSALALGAILWYGGVQQLQGGMTLGGIQAFISYIAFMMWPVQELARVWASMQSSLASAERIFSLVDAVPEIIDREGAQPPAHLRSQICFTGVEFAYDPATPVLQNFNLTINPGETLALVGHTGCGKTTIVNLLCRFYEPQAGQICFGETDYRTFTQQGIQSKIGMVLQDPQLFSGTIRENIRYGRLEASDEEILEAARLARAHDFITRLTKGYDEEVGEGGILLSVGQKQLLSLARAWLANPDIFIMDEATSSIDTLTEQLIQEAQARLFKDRTSIVIAHRLSTIRQADRIIVIEHGKIVEQGDHHQLLALEGHYHALHARGFHTQTEKIAG